MHEFNPREYQIMSKSLQSIRKKGWNIVAGANGFTLVEMMVVLAIIATLGGIAVISVATTRKAGVQYAADEMFSNIQTARMRAARNDSSCTISFNVPAANQYQITINTAPPSTQVIDLANYRGNVTFGNSPNAVDQPPAAQLIFTPQGFATTFGDLYLNSGVDNTWYRFRTTYAGASQVDRWTGAGWN